jgi:SHS2 domain-containing protein
MGSYETFDHTADVGLIIRAPDLDDLFATAAASVVDYMVADRSAVEPKTRETVRLVAASLEDLLLAWLTELIFKCETGHFLFAKFEVHVDEGSASLDATIWGEPFDRARHVADHEIKAVTHHGSSLVREPGGWVARFILDI